MARNRKAKILLGTLMGGTCLALTAGSIPTLLYSTARSKEYENDFINQNIGKGEFVNCTLVEKPKRIINCTDDDDDKVAGKLYSDAYLYSGRLENTPLDNLIYAALYFFVPGAVVGCLLTAVRQYSWVSNNPIQRLTIVVEPPPEEQKNKKPSNYDPRQFKAAPAQAHPDGLNVPLLKFEPRALAVR